MALWGFEDDGGAPILTDLTGRGNELFQSEDPQSAAGKLGFAVSLDGVLQHLSRPSTSDLQIGAGDFLIAAWVKVASFPDGRVQIAFKAGEYGFDILDTGALGFGTDVAGAITPAASVPLDTFKLCIGYISVSQNLIAVRVGNNALVSDVLGTLPAPTSNDFTIGVNDGNEHFFDGLIDEPIIMKTQPQVVVSGAGTSAANGTYTYRGMSGGKPYYNLVGQPDSIPDYSIAWDGVDTWLLRGFDDDQLYLVTNPASFPWLAGAWSVNTGVGPAPTVAKGDDPDALTTEQFDAVCAFIFNSGAGRDLSVLF